jgi:3-deoxy-D-manno-octulosonic-acid transferase
MGAIRPVRDWSRHRTVLAAGSTDEHDEAVLLAAFKGLAGTHEHTGLLLIPHDPDPARLAQILALADRFGVGCQIWDGGLAQPDTACVVVSRLGVLADLYLLADMAYVGGGFRRDKLHAVVEPAAYGLPVMVGPEYACSTDALSLVTAGGAVALPARGATDMCLELWREWTVDEARRHDTGLRARGTLCQGAADASAAALLGLLP